jgi:hypothetical protein
MTDPLETPQLPEAGSPTADEHPPTHLERSDDRWSEGSARRDWLVLFLMMAAYLTWTGIIYFLEPGIR